MERRLRHARVSLPCPIRGPPERVRKPRALSRSELASFRNQMGDKLQHGNDGQISVDETPAARRVRAARWSHRAAPRLRQRG